MGEVIARAMNSKGAVTADFMSLPSFSEQSFVFANGHFMQLSIPGAHAMAGGIDDSGVIAGAFGITPLSLLTAGVFIYDDTGFHNLGTAFGGLPAEEDAVADINNGGVIVGGSELAVSPFVSGWVYFPGQSFANVNSLIDPGSGWSLQGCRAINDAGAILGEGTISGRYDAFLLTPVPEPSTRCCSLP